MRRLIIFAAATTLCAQAAQAQRLTSVGVSAGAAFSDVTHATAAFSLSAGVRFGIPWLLQAHRSVADLSDEPGSQRDVSLALIPVWEPLRGRLFGGIGAAVNWRRVELIDANDEKVTELIPVAVAGIRAPIAGEGVLLELSGRFEESRYSGLFGVRLRPGIPNTLQLGEPRPPSRTAARAAVWNDVVMQLILLQQNLESFTRIKEIETGIELEFDEGRVTVWDDVAKTARVLAAANPPVVITAFGRNAGRVAAAVTAGSFPAERVKLQRADRVYLRVETN